MDCGAFEYSNLSLDWTNQYQNQPCLKISNIGQKQIVIPVSNGTSKNISCWVKYSLDGVTASATTCPQMIISSTENILSTNPVTITAIGAGSSYQLLTTTITPVANGLLTITLFNQINGASGNAYCYFSDFNF